jgi:hypothetical protein
VSFALVGGLAVSIRTEPRFTRDADLAVALANDAEVEALIHDRASCPGHGIARHVCCPQKKGPGSSRGFTEWIYGLPLANVYLPSIFRSVAAIIILPSFSVTSPVSCILCDMWGTIFALLLAVSSPVIW